ncbi:AIPR family protein [Vallitalea maricola]|uniref:AIPR family protein n=1 Tax=Vallitalea maricola TaxID=3074433 RepID=A0ACB5ULV9_9FIRM|nr:AIPR family protein [Vallitalea sp. AN17-2]
MDAITKSFLNEFSLSKNYRRMKESDQFELFVNYCVINKEYDSISFNIKNTLTGRATQGIDGIGIIINNKLCESINEIQDLIDMNRILNVQFVFIQSKTSSKFSGTKIDGFFRWVKSFFSNQANIFETDEMKTFIEMKDFIYNNSKYMKERNPLCKLYYVSTGKWIEDANLKNIIENNIKELDSTNLFESITFNPCDAKILQSMYRKTKEPVTADIHFEKKVILPTIPDVKVSYSGMLPFEEFKKIIIDDTDKMKSVFEDNIRDYLEKEDNPVNNDINTTISNGKFEFFSILNNGVTVVAEQISGAGDDLTITNYQIVNGCQTSHVLYENRLIKGIEKVNVPLKIIITDNPEIKSQITRATNNQTAVEVEQLEALTDFQKNLETFYKALYEDENKLYYERRTNQYKNCDIQNFRIVNIETQIKVFSSMFLNKPHLVTGYYGKLKKEMGHTIFDINHKLEPYYVSSLTYIKLENLFNDNMIEDNMWRYRYHILMLFRVKVAGFKIPPFNSNGMIKYCTEMLSVLDDNDEFIDVIEEIIDLLNSPKFNLNFNDRKTCERKITTDLLLDYFDECKQLTFDFTDLL